MITLNNNNSNGNNNKCYKYYFVVAVSPPAMTQSTHSEPAQFNTQYYSPNTYYPVSNQYATGQQLFYQQ